MHLEDDRSGDADKRLEMKIPEQMHARLHTLEVHTGKKVPEMVIEALEAYLERRAEAPGDREAPGLARGSEDD